MEIRLSGTREECTDLVAVLPDLLGDVAEIRRVSGFYQDRPDAPCGLSTGAGCGPYGGPGGPTGRVYVRLDPRAATTGPPRGRRPGRTPPPAPRPTVRPSAGPVTGSPARPRRPTDTH